MRLVAMPVVQLGIGQARLARLNLGADATFRQGIFRGLRNGKGRVGHAHSVLENGSTYGDRVAPVQIGVVGYPRIARHGRTNSQINLAEPRTQLSIAEYVIRDMQYNFSYIGYISTKQSHYCTNQF
jgi:hypothetical protein